jgi:ASCH domain
MLALSIRQPFAELILRGIKTVEYRSRPTRVIARRFFIYASKGAATAKAVWSRDLAVPAPGEALPSWMIELAEQVGMIEPGRWRSCPGA